jgi:hypothetical protein
MRAKAKQTLEGAIQYTYRVGVRLDHDRADREARTLALRIMSLAKEGFAPNLDAASIMAFGLCHTQYLKRTAERIQLMNAELARCIALCIPDYDPAEARHAAMVKAGRKRRPEAFSGNLYEMLEEERSAQPQPMRNVPRKTA